QHQLRRPRAGRLRRRVERHPQHGSGDHEGVTFAWGHGSRWRKLAGFRPRLRTSLMMREKLHMIDRETFERHLTRRTFLRRSAGGIGAAALASLLSPELLLGATTAPTTAHATGPVKVPGVLGMTHFAPKAKRVIYLCQSGAPSQMELFDPKP